MTHKLIKTDNYLLVVDDSEIRDIRPFKDRWHLEDGRILNMFPDYLTDLSVCKLIIAHLPLNGSPILEGVDLLPPIEDDVEQLAKVEYPVGDDWDDVESLVRKLAFKNGYNKAKEKYNLTLGKLIDLYVNETGYGMDMWSKEEDETMSTIAKITQPLHQYPTEFETEDILTPSQIFYPNDVPYSSPKTITTAQGLQWVGKYK